MSGCIFQSRCPRFAWAFVCGVASRCQEFGFLQLHHSSARIGGQTTADDDRFVYAVNKTGCYPIRVLPAGCHRWYTLTLDNSCFVIEEFEITVLLVLGLAQGVCDRSASCCDVSEFFASSVGQQVVFPLFIRALTLPCTR